MDSGPPQDDRYAIAARAEQGTRVLKHGDTFGVFDHRGDIRARGLRGVEGLYHEGTRFLSQLYLRLNDERLLLLSSTVRENNLMFAADLTNPELVGRDGSIIPYGALHVLRSRLLWRASCYERLELSSYCDAPVDVRLVLGFGADFADVFEVRGTERARRGQREPLRIVEGEALLDYVALDGERLRARVCFEPKPDAVLEDRVELAVSLQPRGTYVLRVTIRCETVGRALETALSFDEAHAAAGAALARSQEDECRISTSNEDFNAWIERSIADLHMLASETPYGPFPYAGVPWFSTPFGRDGIITALEALWVNPRLARGVLGYLADTQASEHDPSADAEPGKILHELRHGEMARMREIPFGRYYGSVDSTPLFVALAAAYFDATGEQAFVESLWPAIERALSWIDEHGDADGDGFVEYDGRKNHGLTQQGWKDSHDSVFHADGSPAEGPIALCEVQGYVYAARRGAARIARALGRVARAVELELKAEALMTAFDEAFFSEELGTYALALDGHKHRCLVRASNAGHCLLTGIARADRAPVVAEQLLSPEMFSGWGIRTLATSERRYNPMSYHNGSIWPHDNALIAAGLARYGLTAPAMRVLEGLFDASRHMELHRLPELFCGFPRRQGEGPTLYPAACAPQAWAAAAPLLVLQASLGLSIEASTRSLRFDRAALPVFLETVRLSNLRAGAASADLLLHRYADNVGLNVLQRRGEPQVISLK